MEVPIPVCVVILFPAQWQEHLWGRRYWTINHEETLESIYLSTENDDRKANDEDTLQHIADGVWEGGHPLQCVCSNLDEQVFSSQHRIYEWKDDKLSSQLYKVCFHEVIKPQ